MTVKEAAEALEISASSVYALCQAGRLGHERIGLGRGVIRISPEDVARLRAQSRVEPARANRRKDAGASDFGGHVFRHVKPRPSE